MFPRGLCFSECCDAPVPSQNKNQQQLAGHFGAGPLAFRLTSDGKLECAAIVHPLQPEVVLRRKGARGSQPLPAAAVAVVEEEEEEEEEGAVKVRQTDFVFLIEILFCWLSGD